MIRYQPDREAPRRARTCSRRSRPAPASGRFCGTPTHHQLSRIERAALSSRFFFSRIIFAAFCETEITHNNTSQTSKYCVLESILTSLLGSSPAEILSRMLESSILEWPAQVHARAQGLPVARGRVGRSSFFWHGAVWGPKLFL